MHKKRQVFGQAFAHNKICEILRFSGLFRSLICQSGKSFKFKIANKETVSKGKKISNKIPVPSALEFVISLYNLCTL